MDCFYKDVTLSNAVRLSYWHGLFIWCTRASNVVLFSFERSRRTFRECYPLGARASTPGRIQTKPLPKFQRHELDENDDIMKEEEDGDLSEEHVYPIWTPSSDSGQSTCETCGAEKEQCTCYGPQNRQRTDKLAQRRVSYHEPSWRYKTANGIDNMAYDTHSTVRNTRPSEACKSNNMSSDHTDTYGIHSAYHRPDTELSEKNTSVHSASPTNYSKGSLGDSEYGTSRATESDNNSPRTLSTNAWRDRRSDMGTYIGNSRLSPATSGSRKKSHRVSDMGPSAHSNGELLDRCSPPSISGTDESGKTPLRFSSGTHSMDTDSYDDSRPASVSSGNRHDSMSTGTGASDSISSVTRETASSRTISSESASVGMRGSYSGTSGTYSSKSYSGSLSTTPSSSSIAIPESNSYLCSKELNLENQEELERPDEPPPPITDIKHTTEKSKPVQMFDNVVSGPSCPVNVSADVPTPIGNNSQVDEDLASPTLDRHDFALERRASSLITSFVPVMEGIPETSGTDSVSTSVSNTSLNDDLRSMQAGCDPIAMEKILEVSGADSVSNTAMDDCVDESSITIDTQF